MSQEDKEISQDVQEVDNQTGNENLEREARVFGWVPKEEFRGSDTDWVDAEVFVKRGKEINPILRKNNELLLKKLDEKGKEIDSIKASVEEFKKFQKESFERKSAEYEIQIATLKTKKREAIAAGDGNLVVDLDDQIDDLKDAQKEAKQEATKKPEPPKTEAVQVF